MGVCHSREEVPVTPPCCLGLPTCTPLPALCLCHPFALAALSSHSLTMLSLTV